MGDDADAWRSAADQMLEIAAHGFMELRNKGASDEEIEALLGKLEAHNPANVPSDVLRSVMTQLRLKIGLRT